MGADPIDLDQKYVTKVNQADTVAGTGTNAVAQADTPATAGRYLVFGAMAWYESATQTGWMQIQRDPGDTNDRLGGAPVGPGSPGMVVFPVPIIVNISGSEFIRAELSAGGVAVVGRVRLFAKRLGDV